MNKNQESKFDLTCRASRVSRCGSVPAVRGRWAYAIATSVMLAGIGVAQAQGPVPVTSPYKKAVSPAPPVGSRLAMVNVMQGTNSIREFSHGNVLPLISAPFGMTDWSVQNAGDINERFFFQSRRNSFLGIRATHQPSPWAGDYGHFLISPQTGPVVLDAEDRTCSYDPATTVMRPDYLRIRLDKYKLTTELTSSERSSVWRVNFDAGQKTGRFVFDFPGDAQLQMKGNRVWGYTKYHGGPAAGDFHCYFVGVLDRPVTGGQAVGTETTSGKGSGYVEFATDNGKPLEMRIATSFISPEQAQVNLERETVQGFESVRKNTADAWEKLLSRIAVEGSEERKETFYSCLYRSLKYPRKIYENNAAGETVHYSPWSGKIEKGPAYTDTGLWDTFRTQFPLFSIAYPDVYGEMVDGWLNAYREGGWLTHWPNPGGFRAMPGTYADTMIADAMVKGIKGFDYSTAYEALRKDAFEIPVGQPGKPVGGKDGMEDYLRLGYIPARKTEYWVSMTQDHAYNDWSVAQAAKLMGKTDDYQALMKRSQNYKNLWDASNGFMRSKTEQGNWAGRDFDQYAWGGGYTESGPWQSSWGAQYDALGLADLTGGREAFGKVLDDLFTHPPIFKTGGYNGVIHEMVEFVAVGMGQYGACNQPSFHLPYLYAGIGQPWKTEYWTRRACRQLFNAGPDGFAGDDDNGSNASWYLLSSMGIYPLTPGHPSYVLTSPEFDSVKINLPNGKAIMIGTKGNSEKNVYVKSRTINGKPWTNAWISQADLVGGAKIVNTMSDKPNVRELKADELPYSAKTELAGKSF
ncbi:glycoside hydrolase family 92 protein [bacterium]|nr:MAG: glycoside hydrolase family 92 protein [bacterium]